MKAAVVRAFGQQLQIEEMPGRNKVLVKVIATYGQR